MRKLPIAIALTLALAGCQTVQQDRAFTGAAIGGVAGTAIGAAAGRSVGGAVAAASYARRCISCASPVRFQ